jgi:hypothetical protein
MLNNIKQIFNTYQMGLSLLNHQHLEMKTFLIIICLIYLLDFYFIFNLIKINEILKYHHRIKHFLK